MKQDRRAGVSGHSRASHIFIHRRRTAARNTLMKSLLIAQPLFGARKSASLYAAKVLRLIPTLALIGMATIQGNSRSPEAQDSEEWRKQVREVLQETEKSFAQFRAMRQEAQHDREQARARIYDYTAALARATSELQKHIADLHPSRTNCQACRKQVKELRTLIRRIGQILE